MGGQRWLWWLVWMHTRRRTRSWRVDGNGRKLAEKTVEATDAGHAKALRWALLKFGGDELTWGIEDCRHVSARLERSLVDAGQRVMRVNTQTHGPVPWLGSPPGQVRSD